MDVIFLSSRFVRRALQNMELLRQWRRLLLFLHIIQSSYHRQIRCFECARSIWPGITHHSPPPHGFSGFRGSGFFPLPPSFFHILFGTARPLLEIPALDLGIQPSSEGFFDVVNFLFSCSSCVFFFFSSLLFSASLLLYSSVSSSLTFSIFQRLRAAL